MFSAACRISCALLCCLFFQRGTLYDEYERLNNKKETISPDRVLRLFLGICKGLQMFHTHLPEALAHR